MDGGIIKASCVVALALPGVAFAAGPVLPDGAPEACKGGAWQLKGAPQDSEEDASFNADWVRDLDEVATCLKDERLARTCVMVQGRYDEAPFVGPVGKALGGQTAAQTLRARGRALRVLSWLYDAGVPPARIRERPPPSQPSWRGVLVELLVGCVPPKPEPVIIAAQPDMEQVRAVVREALAEQPAGEKTQLIHVELPPPPPDTPGPWWLSAGVGVGGLFADGADNVATGLTRIGAGWTGQHTYAQLHGGLTFGSETGQSRGWETGLGLGWHALHWLDVGARAGHRVSGADFTEPWADQAWFGGVESAQCQTMVAGLDLCVEELVGGGWWTQRAVEVGDTFFFVPEEERGALVLGFAVAMRQGL